MDEAGISASEANPFIVYRGKTESIPNFCYESHDAMVELEKRFGDPGFDERCSIKRDPNRQNILVVELNCEFRIEETPCSDLLNVRFWAEKHSKKLSDYTVYSKSEIKRYCGGDVYFKTPLKPRMDIVENIEKSSSIRELQTLCE